MLLLTGEEGSRINQVPDIIHFYNMRLYSNWGGAWDPGAPCMKSVGVPQRLDACLRVLLMDVYGAWRVS